MLFPSAVGLLACMLEPLPRERSMKNELSSQGQLPWEEGQDLQSGWCRKAMASPQCTARLALRCIQ